MLTNILVHIDMVSMFVNRLLLMRISYNGITLAFQVRDESSILSIRSVLSYCVMEARHPLTMKAGDRYFVG